MCIALLQFVHNPVSIFDIIHKESHQKLNLGKTQETMLGSTFSEWQWSNRRRGNSSKIGTIISTPMTRRRAAVSSRFLSTNSSQSFEFVRYAPGIWLLDLQNILVIEVCWSFFDHVISSPSFSHKIMPPFIFNSIYQVFFSAKNQSPTWRPGTYEELYFYGFPAKMIAKSSH